MTRSEPMMPVSIKLDPALLSEVDRIGRREYRTRSGIVRLALVAYLKADKSDKAGEPKGRRAHKNAK
jgi:metal-responsive CopG/Arc/MetJ family transcriptional regulator